MRAKRGFLCRVIKTVPWVYYDGVSYAPWVYRSASEVRDNLKVDISWVEQVESIEVHLLGDFPKLPHEADYYLRSKRVMIKASEE